MSPFQIDFWVARGLSVEDAKKKIASFRPSQPEFWIAKGYSEEDAKSKVKEHNKTANKRRKPLPPEKRLVRKEYWVAKGYSEEEAKEQVRLRQSTVTEKRFVDRYGSKEGKRRFAARNLAWQDKMREQREEINEKIIRTTMAKAGKDAGHLLACRNSREFCNEAIRRLEESFDLTAKSFHETYRHTGWKVHYKNWTAAVNEAFAGKIVVRRAVYSTIFCNGHRLNSWSEFRLLRKLQERHNAECIVTNQRYPNSRYQFDMHLKCCDTYIEYAGLMKVPKYAERLRKKLLKHKNLNIVVLTSHEEIDEFANQAFHCR